MEQYLNLLLLYKFPPLIVNCMMPLPAFIIMLTIKESFFFLMTGWVIQVQMTDLQIGTVRCMHTCNFMWYFTAKNAVCGTNHTWCAALPSFMNLLIAVNMYVGLPKGCMGRLWHAVVRICHAWCSSWNQNSSSLVKVKSFLPQSESCESLRRMIHFTEHYSTTVCVQRS